jgi:hypothetical protein
MNSNPRTGVFETRQAVLQPEQPAGRKTRIIAMHLEAWRRLWGRCAGGEHGRKVPAPAARPLLPAAACSAAAASGEACCLFSALPGLMAAAAIAARCSSSSHLHVGKCDLSTAPVLGVLYVACTAAVLQLCTPARVSVYLTAVLRSQFQSKICKFLPVQCYEVAPVAGPRYASSASAAGCATGIRNRWQLLLPAGTAIGRAAIVQQPQRGARRGLAAAHELAAVGLPLW